MHSILITGPLSETQLAIDGEPSSSSSSPSLKGVIQEGGKSM